MESVTKTDDGRCNRKNISVTTSPPYITKQASEEDTRQRCPYAGSAFKQGEVLAKCRICGTLHLEESWKENGGCTTYGCENTPDFRKDQQAQQGGLATQDRAGGDSYQPLPPPSPALPTIKIGPGVKNRDPKDADLRALVTWTGFVTGLVGMSAPSYLASLMGLVISGIALGLNLSSRDPKRVPYAAAGIVAAVLGFLFATIERAL